uniref:Uncharacterized protein n=1 Tax=Candidatus Kentrum sp. TC TaxID=2126339 RepID=A0A451A910_9GAMM|nr:MAG: hypothetical protein BECKTC1821F_GA0114240_107510 [Candidatus Kentron sp. TC]
MNRRRRQGGAALAALGQYPRHIDFGKQRLGFGGGDEANGHTDDESRSCALPMALRGASGIFSARLGDDVIIVDELDDIEAEMGEARLGHANPDHLYVADDGFPGKDGRNASRYRQWVEFASIR